MHDGTVGRIADALHDMHHAPHSAFALPHSYAATIQACISSEHGVATLPALALHRLDPPSWLKQLVCPLCLGVAQTSVCLTRSVGATFLLMSTDEHACTQWRTPWPAATGYSILACSRPPGVVEVKAFARYAPSTPDPCMRTWFLCMY